MRRPPRPARTAGLGALLAALAGAGCGHSKPVQTPAREARTVASMTEVGRYRVFERSFANDFPYANRFVDVELHATYTSPSGRNLDFAGFFDGDGQGGGGAQSGNIWRMRFL